VNEDPGLVDIVRIDIAYSNADFPITVNLSIEKAPSASDTTRSGTCEYAQNQDGSGRLTFDWVGATAAGIPVTARMVSQWIGSGAGRADSTAELSGVSTLLGTDCWGTDSVATYTYRRGVDDPLKPGQETCLFR
jgi:hypothetical protein